jgi:hypothetical protein
MESMHAGARHRHACVHRLLIFQAYAQIDPACHCALAAHSVAQRPAGLPGMAHRCSYPPAVTEDDIDTAARVREQKRLKNKLAPPPPPTPVCLSLFGYGLSLLAIDALGTKACRYFC